MVAPSKRIFTSTTLSLVGISSPWTAACATTAGLPSAAGTFLSRVCVPLRDPFSKVNVGTTLCHSFAGSAFWKSSENKSSFFLAMESPGTGGNSAAKAVDKTSVAAAQIQREIMLDVDLITKWLHQRRLVGQQNQFCASFGAERFDVASQMREDARWSQASVMALAPHLFPRGQAALRCLELREAAAF